jgi:hypothetical protein
MTRRLRLPFALPALALALLWVIVRSCFEVRPAAPLPAATRTAVVRALRAVLEASTPDATAAEGAVATGAAAPDVVAAPPVPVHLEGHGLERPSRGPVWVSLFRLGAPAVQRECVGATVGAALSACARELAVAVRGLGWNAADRAAARIKVDVTTAEGPVPAWPTAALALGVVPGVDGLGVRLDGREARLLPDELLRADLLNGYRPLERFAEVSAGLHVPRVVTVLARRLEVDGPAWAHASKRFFRFRTDTFVEPATPASGPPLDVVRGTAVSALRLDAEAARAAAVAGAHYLLRHQRPDGSFVYEYETVHDAALTSDYSLPRHFGTTSFLAEVYGATRDPAIGGAVRRALAWGETQINPACADAEVACMAPADAATADLGSTALAPVALAEHRRHGGDPVLDPLAHRLAAFLLRMQRPAGDFAHLYRLREHRPDPASKLLYYDGEATLALVKAYDRYRDPRYLEGARRGLDWLTKAQYRHFAGRFYFGEDHWTCIAAGAAWPHLRDPVYETFCRKYAAFLRRQQFQPGDHPPDLRGAYGFTPFLLPHNTPTGSRTEAMVSAYLLGRHHGRADERIRMQVEAALRFLLQQQLQPDACYLCADPARSAGGFLESPAARRVRIDYVQHAGSALLRGSELL